ncbi:Uncharacterised protein [uncultured archaeon]|nr:Uncharacterised protein [uncultured archaeon]
MDEEKKEHEHVAEHVEHHKKSHTEKIRENPWIISSIVLGILSLILLISMFSGNFTGNAISASQAGEKLLGYYNSMGVSNLTLDSVKEVSGVYQVNLDYKGQIVPLYITKDGKNSIDSLTPLESSSSDSTTQQEVPKADKPIVELYVFAYCPYGLQMEKAIIPVVKLLGNTIDFRIRQIGAMHGDYEKVEAERQLCIEKNYPSKYLDYISTFAADTTIGACSGDATCLTPLLSSIYTKLGIDASKINACMTTDGVTMYNNEVSNAQSMGISGSPTLVINGVQASADRNSEAIKGVICNSFNTVASQCSQTLSTTAASAGFGSGSSSSSSSASCN